MRIGGLERLAGAALAAFVSLTGTAALADEEVNLYSSRHYDTDERLYSDFTEATGIKINRIEGRPSVLLERIKAEGRNSPADILLTTDAGRLWAAEEAGVLQSIESQVLEERIPAELRHPKNLWFGFSTRARVIFYDKASVDPATIQTYDDLADPKNKGLVCTRTSGNIYMVSLLASIIHHKGSDGALNWAKGVWANRARAPQGGDTDQLRGIRSGECAIAVSNTYYFARAIKEDVSGLSGPDLMDKIGIVFPNQETTGTHVNVSGGGVLQYAPNKDNAVKFLEYLSSAQAQEYFANGNNEYPVAEGVAPGAAVNSLGTFQRDTTNLRVLGENQAEARRIYDAAGYR